MTPTFASGRIDWEMVIRDYAKDNDCTYGDAVRYMTQRDSLETAASLLGVQLPSTQGLIIPVIDSLAEFLDSRGFTPPKRFSNANEFIIGKTESMNTRNSVWERKGARKVITLTREEYLEALRKGEKRTAIKTRYGIAATTFYSLLSTWGIHDAHAEATELAKYSAQIEVSATREAQKENPTKLAPSVAIPTDANISSVQVVDKPTEPRRECRVSLSMTLNDAVARAVMNDLIDEAHETAVDRGWYEQEVQLPVQLALIHSEVSEALEADRKKQGADKVAEELADVVIRVMDTAAAHKLDLTGALFAKMAHNRGREHRHGGLSY